MSCHSIDVDTLTVDVYSALSLSMSVGALPLLFTIVSFCTVLRETVESFGAQHSVRHGMQGLLADAGFP